MPIFIYTLEAQGTKSCTGGVWLAQPQSADWGRPVGRRRWGEVGRLACPDRGPIGGRTGWGKGPQVIGQQSPPPPIGVWELIGGEAGCGKGLWAVGRGEGQSGASSLGEEP